MTTAISTSVSASKKPSRPLLRLVKTTDKLQQAVAIAAQEKLFPTAADFAKAVQQVAPRKAKKSKTQLPNTNSLKFGYR
ncbi:hypothetical protein I8751_15965 [Nostocaceae cyanobacterium CENA357]|uniref:Uncharacterized protein n=1 Tax=Atlanticothrix silvestris CENA357 TaxID=1725252 RepID=A0A8J7HJZ1_9CYAN|nr:hypothetical protein [Atlanticothrix silvestris]MBH8553840.1 hypothetical protein [Atlanticothrix silvestris CENA357]